MIEKLNRLFWRVEFGIMLVVLLAAPVLAVAQQESAGYSGEGAKQPATNSPANGGEKSANDILNLDIEQLAKAPVNVNVPSMDIPVTSVTKEMSTVGRSPAAVFVITSEMIHRSTANTIPDLLRMVPGLDIAQVESSTWDVTSRGFKSHFSNKLLVLIDGRTVYTPEFSGVYWDVQDLLLEDIERIEVIRGPGATLWGANAVNGVINIITKQAKDTQGALITAGGGNQDRTINGVRYGGSDGQGLDWRVWGKQFDRAPNYSPDGADDGWRMGRGGFRVDWNPDMKKSTTFTIQGDYYGGNEGHKIPFAVWDPPGTQILNENEYVSGANVLARWTHVVDEKSDSSFQAYFDQTYRDEPIRFEQIDTLDLEWQNRFPLSERHEVTWGLNYRQIHDDFRDDGFATSFDPLSLTMNLYGAFIQDEITLIEDRLTFTAGTKLENNYFTAFNCQPSGRLLWTPNRKNSVWAAVSRAVRTPSQFERDGFATNYPIPQGNPPVWTFLRWVGNQNFGNEELMAYEIGYRSQVSDHFAFDISAFYNVYDDLKTKQLGTPVFVWPDKLLLPFDLVNVMPGQTYGVEAVGYWTLSDTWRLTAWYSLLRMQLHELDIPPEFSESGDSPRHQARLQSSWDLGCDWQFDLSLRYVDSLSSVQQVPSYISMDARLAWAPSKNFELALIGQNLLEDHHMEANPYQYLVFPTQPRRSVFAKATWRY